MRISCRRQIRPLSTLKIFSPNKHQNCCLCTITINDPYANPNKDSNPSSLRPETHLVPSNKMNQEHTCIRVSNSDTFHEIVSSNKIITGHIRSGDFDSALRVFGNVTIKTTVTWNAILTGYGKKRGKLKEAQEWFDKIPQPNTVSYNIMLSCLLLNSKDIETAIDFFNNIPVKDIASWNTMISGFVQKKDMARARELFLAMPEKNRVSWSAMISGYIECGDLDDAVELFEVAPVKSVVAWTAMISGYMKFGKVELAEKLFKEMPVKNLVTWNAMIAGYVVNSRAGDGLKLFRTMIGSGLRPNASSLSSILLGCSELSALLLGKQVHQLVCKSPLSNDTAALNPLISMYCKCGDLEDAWKLFLEFQSKDVVTWNVMISGYAQHGAGEKALRLFDEMKQEGMKPDWITFVAVLLACNHAGLVDLGIQYFDSMIKDYGMEARPDHYTCMVDLLGRAGKLVEAVDLIKKMPFKPHPAIFGTLLSACRIHKRLDLAEFAAKNLLNLDPTNAAGYVQLANIYATMNKWDIVARIRRSMKENNVVKLPAYSWIEVGAAIHEFRSGDRLHPELVSIHEKLKELEKKMKLAGYVPDFESALHDVGEKVKQQLLLFHSEKLAIAYGLMKVPLGAPIRVFKNLRVCRDCHLATKYISAIERREIIVRDTTRFHHFKDGICSCNDYW